MFGETINQELWSLQLAIAVLPNHLRLHIQSYTRTVSRQLADNDCAKLIEQTITMFPPQLRPQIEKLVFPWMAVDAYNYSDIYDKAARVLFPDGPPTCLIPYLVGRHGVLHVSKVFGNFTNLLTTHGQLVGEKKKCTIEHNKECLKFNKKLQKFIKNYNEFSEKARELCSSPDIKKMVLYALKFTYGQVGKKRTRYTCIVCDMEHPALGEGYCCFLEATLNDGNKLIANLGENPCGHSGYGQGGERAEKTID